MHIHWYSEMDASARQERNLSLNVSGPAWVVIPTARTACKLRSYTHDAVIDLVVTRLSKPWTAEWVERLLHQQPWPPGADHLHLGWSRLLNGRKTRFWAVFTARDVYVAPGTMARIDPPAWLPAGLRMLEHRRTAYDHLDLG